MNKQGKTEWIEVLIWIIIAVLFIMVLTRIFGNSTTDVQIYIGFITGLIGIVFFIAKDHREIGVMKSKMKYNFSRIEGNMKHSFSKVKEDMNRIESKIDNLSKSKTRGKK